MQSQATRWSLQRLASYSSCSSTTSSSSLPLLRLLTQKTNGLAKRSNHRPSLGRQTTVTGWSGGPSPPRVTIPAIINFSASSIAVSFFATTPFLSKNTLPPKPKPIPDEELVEAFIRGWGPGGQKTNKTSAAVHLKHLPTGVYVKCFETRSREQNRHIARKLLAAKVDILINGENSREFAINARKKKQKDRAHRKAQKKHREAAEAKKEAKTAPSGQNVTRGEKDDNVAEDDDVDDNEGTDNTMTAKKTIVRRTESAGSRYSRTSSAP